MAEIKLVNGLQGFYEKTKQKLEKLGVFSIMRYDIETLHINSSQTTVTLSTDEAITGNRILWAARIEAIAKLLDWGEIGGSSPRMTLSNHFKIF